MVSTLSKQRPDCSLAELENDNRHDNSDHNRNRRLNALYDVINVDVSCIRWCREHLVLFLVLWFLQTFTPHRSKGSN